MRFYKIEGTIENKDRIKNSENRRAAREISDNIALLSRAFNESGTERVLCMLRIYSQTE